MNTIHDQSSRVAARTTNRAASAGKAMLATAAGLTAAGGFLADMNKTHMFNPNWPPHAKFHDAVSITLGAFLGSTGLYFLFRKGAQDINLGAALPAFFWASMGISFAYPGAKGIQAEFPELTPRISKFWLNEEYAALAMLSLLAAGYTLARRK